jgi:CMP-2-keto-3-deoxyoctulosonic acid synthetase
MDKKALKITSIHDSDVHEYWRKKSYIERIEALEQLRRIIFGYDPSTTRLQRTITVTKLKKD